MLPSMSRERCGGGAQAIPFHSQQCRAEEHLGLALLRSLEDVNWKAGELLCLCSWKVIGKKSIKPFKLTSQQCRSECLELGVPA